MIKTLRILAIALLGITESHACGLSWNIPKFHFDHVQEQGRVSYFEKLADLDFGDGLTLPLTINFDSGRESVSPYLGKGWLFNFVESYVYPTDENSFYVVMPDGYHYQFARTKENPNVLKGNRGWMAEEKDGIFRAWAPCGWKIEWQNGKISRITTDKDRKIEFRRNSAGLVEEISENGLKEVLTLLYDSKNHQVSGFQVNGKKIEIQMADKPEVQEFNKTKVIAGFNKSLGGIKRENQEQTAYTYGADLNASTLTFSVKDLVGGKNHDYAWDITKRTITSADGWKYTVIPKSNGSDANIERRNSKNELEYFKIDHDRGTLMTKDLEKGEMEKTWFASGLLAGKTRKEVVSNKTKKNSTLYTYNEKGRLVKWMENDDVFTYELDESGNRLSLKKNNTQIWKRIIKNNTEIMFYADGSTKETVHNQTERFRDWANDLSAINGIDLKKIGHFVVSKNKQRTELSFYDSNGRFLVSKNL